MSRPIPLNPPLSPPNTHLTNKVSTAKYSLLTFIPKFLYESFSKYANLFFLFTACIQQIKGVSPTSPYTTIVPLGFVLAVSAFKEIVEDLKRHRSDAKLNASAVKVLINRTFQKKAWKDLHVGDIVRLENLELCPADIIILSSSEPDALCYIETSNLDGETNLKIRQGLPETSNLLTPEAVASLEGTIHSEAPNNSLYTYSGLLTSNGKETPLEPAQLLLRGAQIKNTKWVYGVVVTTGHETKLMRNATAAPIKRTSVERMINTQILYLLMIMLLLAFLSTFGQYVTERNRAQYGYLRLTEQSAGDWFKNFLTFIILYNNLIPISLIVTVEFVKYQQSHLINFDVDMSLPQPAVARTSSLVEELGQVEYIFSDKTGTLTCNEMEYQMCSIGGYIYSSVIPPGKEAKIDEQGIQTGYYTFDMMRKHISEKSSGQVIHEFYLLLAVCHTVIPERVDDNPEDIVYQASSPDEGALVKGASNFGYKFHTRTPRSVLISYNGEDLEYQILNVCEFNSTRKRMSTIVRNNKGEIYVMCKGADTVIFERLAKDQDTESCLSHLEEFAAEGLRTLCIAQRKISQAEYDNWSKIHDKAAASLIDRSQALDDAAELIEKDLELLGATAIEDKLQEGVPDTIFTLQQAGIKVWVLTGDRQETAINIGYSCKLLNENTNLVICNEENAAATKSYLHKQLGILRKAASDEFSALIIDGKALDYALLPDIAQYLLEVACLCKAVVCCRVSPLQKAQVVNLVKKNKQAITLAIGDGANDVGMIQAAHIGVGISGHEGLQAARSADFAIGQFRYLRKLLLVHGAWSYSRLSKLILYSFYKNITLYLTQFWFSIFNNYSGQTLYDSWVLSMFNVLFTAAPPIVIGMLDQYANARMLDRYPMLYALGREKRFLNVTTFWGAAINAFWHSLILYFGGALMLGEGFLGADGQIADLWYIGTVIYTLVLATVILKACAIADYWTYWTMSGIPGSFLVWLIFIAIYGPAASKTGVSEYLGGVVEATFRSWTFWFGIIIFPTICLTRDIAWKYLRRTLHPSPYHIVQEIQKYNIPDYRPRAGVFRKAVQRVKEIQQFRRTRGFAFSQNDSGQASLIRRYDTTLRKPKG